MKKVGVKQRCNFETSNQRQAISEYAGAPKNLNPVAPKIFVNCADNGPTILSLLSYFVPDFMTQKYFKQPLLPAVVLVFFFITAFELNYFEVSKNLDIFAQAYREVNLSYVDDVPPGALMEAAIEGMLGSLDPYTNFIPENRVEDFRIQTTGQYGGIGATIRKIGEYTVIVQPYKGFAADKAGLRAGDLLLEVDGKSLKGLDTEEVTNLLKGSPGSAIKLQFRRSGETRTVDLVREEVQLKSVPYYGYLENGYGYITLTSFTDKSTKEVKEALLALKDSGDLKGLVLDLRSNPGGLLHEAVNIVNLFVDKGIEAVSMRGKSKEVDRVYRTLNEPVDTELPLVVLINQNSASASEIVSGTLQDLDRAVVIGQRSFGKGLVQQPRKLSYGAQIKITIAKYYTAAGRCIQAINYTEREGEGARSRVPDSLRTAFQTKNGRPVFDGGGIDPDIVMERAEFSNILVSLVGKSHLFDFANAYAAKHREIAPAGSFTLSEAEFHEFVRFLDGKDYEYETRTERAIRALKETASQEQYEELEADIQHMKALLKKSKEADLMRHRAEITRFLEEEIVARYYYQEGRIAQSIQQDAEVKEALQILKDGTRRTEILGFAR
jgi:carboxyl-terminal processing protease